MVNLSVGCCGEQGAEGFVEIGNSDDDIIRPMKPYGGYRTVPRRKPTRAGVLHERLERRGVEIGQGDHTNRSVGNLELFDNALIAGGLLVTTLSSRLGPYVPQPTDHDPG
ncbi:hypothetical protein [Nocardia asteroides]